jgi:hypothetical protein
LTTLDSRLRWNHHRLAFSSFIAPHKRTRIRGIGEKDIDAAFLDICLGVLKNRDIFQVHCQRPGKMSQRAKASQKEKTHKVDLPLT